MDKDAEEGYWLPVDAEWEDQSNWLLTNRVVGQIKVSPAKHVIVVADSCFSGAITRGFKVVPDRVVGDDDVDFLKGMMSKKARIALTSGGLEPVIDSGGGKNSVFSKFFISALRENSGVMTGSRLFNLIRAKVMANSSQTPEYGDIHQTGHDGGDFLFVKQD